MKNQIEMNETEILQLALKQLQEQGKVPGFPTTVWPSRSTETDDEGQYTFIYRWDEPDQREGPEG